jgi:hypothetical protein
MITWETLEQAAWIATVILMAVGACYAIRAIARHYVAPREAILIRGRIVAAGDLEVNGEQITGVMVECTREELKNNRSNIIEIVEVRKIGTPQIIVRDWEP